MVFTKQTRFSFITSQCSEFLSKLQILVWQILFHGELQSTGNPGLQTNVAMQKRDFDKMLWRRDLTNSPHPTFAQIKSLWQQSFAHLPMAQASFCWINHCWWTLDSPNISSVSGFQKLVKQCLWCLHCCHTVKEANAKLNDNEQFR